MSKELKMYIPVTYLKTRIKLEGFRPKRVTERKTILIGVHNCPVIREQLPSQEDIVEHMLIQRKAMDLGIPWTSIKISVTPTKFKELCQELSHKLGTGYQSPIIDMVFEAGQKPIIQIQGTKLERNDGQTEIKTEKDAKVNVANDVTSAEPPIIKRVRTKV